jgi:hypothetical protein
MKIPCLIIAYARSENVLNLINSLRLQGVSEFYIAIDGPKDISVSQIQSDLVKQLEVLNMQQGVSVHIWLRNENLGVATSVITALDWFFKHEEFGIIMEDDLSVSSDFIKFVSRAMQISTQEVSLLSGNRFFSDPRRALYSGYPATWGWATWRDEWRLIRNSIIESPKIKLRHIFSSDYQFWLLGSLRVLLRQVDTWDIPISLYMRNNIKYSLLPSVNLVTNFGFDSFASHTHVNNFPLGMPIENFDSFELSNESRITRIYDRKLRTQVFNVRFRHRFLALHLTLSYLRLRAKGNELKNKVLQVSLPG